MEQPNNDTFCVAPWFQIRNENNMQKKVCCNIQTSTENHENKTALDFLNIDENIHNILKVLRLLQSLMKETNLEII